jgi:VWFA-related protein
MVHNFAAMALPAALGLSLLFPSQTQTTRPSERRTQQVYVSVLDKSGKPVDGLTPADFAVREDGVAREVLRVEPATEPLTIAITVDDSQSATPYIQFLRDGLLGFVKRLDGKGEIALSTVAERPTSVVDYTKNTADLEKGIKRLFARTGAGSYLLDALVDLSKGLEKREAARPTIVVLNIDNGVEFSNLYYQNVLEALRKGGAALHVLSLGTPSSSNDDEIRNRNMVIAEGTAMSGGRRDQVLAESGIPDRLLQLADELTHQYVVSYARPETLIPPEKLDVSATKPGLTVRAPKRLKGK